MREFAQFLKAERGKRELGKTAFATWLNRHSPAYCFTATAIARWEEGKLPHFSSVIDLPKILGVSTDLRAMISRDKSAQEKAGARRRAGKKSRLVEDDASKYLDSLSPEERRPQSPAHELPRSNRSFTQAERQAARLSYTPHLREQPKD